MSFLSLVSRTQITGLSTGSWTTNVNLASFQAIPIGAKSAIIQFEVPNSGGANYGIQKGGGTENLVITTNQTYLRKTVFVELTAGKIDLYCSNNTNGKFYLLGYTNHITHLTTPIEKGGSVSAGTYTLDYSAELPADAANGAILMELSKNVKIGAYGFAGTQQTYAVAPRTTVIVKLDSLRRCQYVSAGGTTLDSDLRVVGWLPAGAFIENNAPTARVMPDTTNWTALTDISTTTIFDMWGLTGTVSLLHGLRAGGDTGYTTTNFQSQCGRDWVAPNQSTGQVEAKVSNVAVNFWRLGGLVASVAAANIVGIDQLVAGATSTVTLDKVGFTVTSFTISDGSISKIVSASLVSSGVYSFTAPSWVDNTTGLKYGSVTVTATDGTETTPIFNATLIPPVGYAAQVLDSVSPYSFGASYSPSLAIGSQVLYKTSDGYVYPDGVWDDNGTGFVGVTPIHDRSPSDFITRFGSLTVAPSGGGSASVISNLSLGFGIGSGI